jgi:hypothetical protein
MKTVLGFSALLFTLYTVIKVALSGVQSAHSDLFVPYLIMLPGTLSVIISSIYAADTVYFRLFKMKMNTAFIVSSVLFVITVILMFAGNIWTARVNTIELIPNYLFSFVWFPLSIIAVGKIVEKSNNL